MGANFLRAEGLGREFARQGHDVWLAGPRGRWEPPTGSPAVDELRIVRSPGIGRRLLLPAAFSPLATLGVLASVRKLAPHIVHSFGHRPAASIPARFLQKGQGARHVADWSDWWGGGGIAAERSWVGRTTVGALDAVFERWSRVSADGLTASTSHLAAMARSWGVDSERLLRLPGGARVDVIRPLPMAAARLKYGLSAEDRILVHAGQSAFDLGFLVDCFAEIHRHEPQARLMVIGGNQRRLSQLSRRHGLMERVLVWKRVPIASLGELLACGEVMLLPFPNLGLNLGRFPNRLGDYLSAGRPVVTNTTGDVGRLIEENAIGLAVEPTSQATAQAALRVLSDPVLAAELGNRGREFAEQRMAWSILASEVLAFYARLPQRVEYPR